MSEDNKIEEGLVDTGAKVLGGMLKAAKSKVAGAPKMQVTTPAGKTYNMPRGATSTAVAPAADAAKGSGLKPVGVGTAVAAGTGVGAGVYGYQKAKEYANTPDAPAKTATTEKPTKLPDIDVKAAPKSTAKPMSFSQAFKSAREKATTAGNPSTGQFEYKGKQYQTNVAGEKYVPAAQQTSVEPKTDTVPLPPTKPKDLTSKPESESGKKANKMSEETNPLIAAFLKLQTENPANMFEAAKKAKKDWDGDGKVESGKAEYLGSKIAAAKKAGKMEEAAVDAGSVEGSKSVTKSKPAEDPSTPKSYPGAASTVKGPNPTSAVMSRIAKEEVEFSQAEIDHINSFFLEASVAPNRPEVAAGADSTSDKMSQNDVTGTAESGKKIRKEEVEIEELYGKGKLDTILRGIESKQNELQKKASRANYLMAASQKNDSRKGPDSEKKHFMSKAKELRKEEVEILEGRPKKNPTPETTERDPRKHIQVEAGRAAAGSVVDFTHNDGSKSKITPPMGRKIVSHLQGLKPADRQAAVNKMHDSAEGLKV